MRQAVEQNFRSAREGPSVRSQFSQRRSSARRPPNMSCSLPSPSHTALCALPCSSSRPNKQEEARIAGLEEKVTELLAKAQALPGDFTDDPSPRSKTGELEQGLPPIQVVSLVLRRCVAVGHDATSLVGDLGVRAFRRIARPSFLFSDVARRLSAPCCASGR
jgi:hypothetical protein